MSYFTHVRVRYWGDDGVSKDDVLNVAESHFQKCGYHVEDVMSDFRKALGDACTMFDDLTSSSFEDLLRVLSRKFPTVTFCAWGIGEESGDVWFRRFARGKMTAKRGPFLNG